MVFSRWATDKQGTELEILEQPDVLVQAIGNLIVTYLQLGDADLACELAEQHLDLGDPYVLVNGACAGETPSGPSSCSRAAWPPASPSPS